MSLCYESIYLTTKQTVTVITNCFITVTFKSLIEFKWRMKNILTFVESSTPFPFVINFYREWLWILWSLGVSSIYSCMKNDSEMIQHKFTRYLKHNEILIFHKTVTLFMNIQKVLVIIYNLFKKYQLTPGCRSTKFASEK